jgi:hypothetical protein
MSESRPEARAGFQTPRQRSKGWLMLHSIQAWLGETALAPVVRDAVWAKALLESVHILADALILFSGGMISARLLARAPAAETVRRFAPWLWSAFVVAAITGVTLLTGAGRRGLDNPVFQIKLSVMAGAVLLTATIQWSLWRNPAFWEAPGRRIAAAVAGPACFLLWLATVFAGRLLAYSSAFFAPQY